MNQSHKPGCEVCDRYGADAKRCEFGHVSGPCSCWRGVPCGPVVDVSTFGLVRTEYPNGSSEVHAAGCGSGSCYGGCVPAPILASLVNAPVTRLNGGGL